MEIHTNNGPSNPLAETVDEMAQRIGRACAQAIHAALPQPRT